MYRKNLLFLVILGTAFISTVAFAGEKEEIAKCAAKDSDAARLICYDNLAKSIGVDRPKTTVTTGKGEWHVRTDTSPIDDSVNVYVSLQSEEVVKSGYNTVRPSLNIRCAENKTNVFLSWSLYLGTDTTRMLTRFDNKKATTDKWSISTDNKAVFVPGSDIAFAKKLMNHNKLLTQITPYGESPVMATFDIKGLPEAIAPLREACHWEKAGSSLVSDGAGRKKAGSSLASDGAGRKKAGSSLASDGAWLFKAKCLACHGPDGKGTAMAPAFKGNDYIKNSKAADIAVVIKKGRSGADKKHKNFVLSMPAQASLSDGDIDALVSYLKSLADH